MGGTRKPKRRIVLFVEGSTECGEARQKTLPVFFHKWLDPQLPELEKVGIKAAKFQGVSDYLDNVAEQAEFWLFSGRASFVVGLVDLYGLPEDRLGIGRHASVEEKVSAARKRIEGLVPKEFRHLFRQHFAVHEIEAWLLAYPEQWPSNVRGRISKRPPEQVNFDKPPAKFLKGILGGTYQKTVRARNIFPKVDPQIAIDKCPYLRLLAADLLKIAKALR
ncbi:MAG: DUF4276 family protein [Planctomycetes bacterium]|nr:DUF4276 family protein [Planctomycetota bacterium]